MRSVKRFVVNALLTILSSLVTLVVVEGILRLYFYGNLSSPADYVPDLIRVPDPVLGWHLEPGGVAVMRSLDYLQVVRINSHGLQDVEKDYDLSEDVYRVVILGDSFIEACHVALEENIVSVLRQHLAGRKVEIINLAVTGYGTAQNYLSLRERGLAYKPDLVILAMYPENDVRNDCLEFERMLFGVESYAEARPHPEWAGNGGLRFTYTDFSLIVRQWNERARKRIEREQGGLALYRRTLLYSLFRWGKAEDAEQTSDLYVGWGVFLNAFPPSSFSKREPARYEQMWSEAWKTTDALVRMTCGLARENDAKFMILNVPALIQSDPEDLAKMRRSFPELGFDTDKPSRHLKQLAGELECPFLDLVPAFRKHYAEGGVPLFFRYQDRHWNKEGHRLAADTLAGFLDENGLIPPASGR